MNTNKSKILVFAMLSVVIIFSMFAVSAAQSAVDLGTAGDYVILSKAGISTTGTTAITGNIGTSPIDSTAITGFGLIMDSSNQFATSSLVTGKIYAADYTPATPTVMTTAISDMEISYTDAAGRTLPDYTELGAGDITSMTLTPGLYKWGTGVLISAGGVTISGSSSDIFIFQIAQDLTVANGAIVTLSGGAQAKNIFWQVAGQATLGTTSDFKGIILSQTKIEMQTGATLNGRALAQTAVTLDANVVVSPGTTPIVPVITPPVSSGGSSSGGSSSSGESNSGTSSSSNSASKNNKIIETPIDGKTKLNSYGIKVETDLPVEVEGNIIRVTKSNGIKSEIKIMPVAASEKAMEVLKLKFCTEENNCTIMLKEVGEKEKLRLAYEVKAQKEVKVFGLFRAKMNVEANIDANTEKVISKKIPWWSLISTRNSRNKKQ